MRQLLEEKWLRLIRLYTFNTPVSKGKYRISQLALRLCRTRHRSLPVTIKDGRRFNIDLTSGIQDSVFFLGEYERVISEISKRLISEKVDNKYKDP